MALTTDGVVVRDADDCARLHLWTDLDADGVGVALTTTTTGRLIDADTALLDLGVLRSRAQLLATAPDWDARWAAMTAEAERSGARSADGRSIRVRIERI